MERETVAAATVEEDMSKSNDFPAFPVVAVNSVYSHGISMRDYFAARAMEADLIYQGLEGREDLAHIAAMSYEMADAMLAERNKR